MSQNTVVRARIDEQIKEEASTVLASMGLTVSDAFRMLLTATTSERPSGTMPCSMRNCCPS